MASAVLMAWAFPDRSYAGLAWIALVPLLWAIALARTTLRALVWGWLCGTLLMLFATTWLAPAIGRFAELSTIPSWILLLGVASLEGLALGLSAALLFQARKHYPVWPMAALAPIALVCAEALIPTLFERKLGFTQAGVPGIIQVADLTGLLGLSFLIVMVNGCCYDLAAALRRGRLPWPALTATAMVLALALLYSHQRLRSVDQQRASAPQVRVGVVQGNLGHEEAANPALAAAQFARYAGASRALKQAGAQLIVWPEAAHPYSLQRDRLTAGHENKLSALARELGVPLLAGAMTLGQPDPPSPGEAQARRLADRYNSALLFDPRDANVQIYDKHLLFPVAEYLPFAHLWPRLEEWFPGRRTMAGTDQTLLTAEPLRMGPLICYDELYANFARGLVPLGPNLLVSLGSAAQFGGESAPRQYLALAVFRSIELRRDLVRASQNGISAIVDASGRVLTQTRPVDPEQEPGVEAFGMSGSVALLDGPPSFYARHGDVFAWLNVLAALLLAIHTMTAGSPASPAPHPHRPGVAPPSHP